MTDNRGATEMGRARRRYVAVMGDANDLSTWGGITANFLHAGKTIGFLDAGLDLEADRMRLPRLLWNVGRVLTGDRPGGYQFSDAALVRAWRRIEPTVRGQDMVSQFQAFPRAQDAGSGSVRYGFYIDMPLLRLLEDYGVGGHVGRRVREEMLEREPEAYENAHVVVAMARWGARAIERDCGLAAGSVHVVVPGANVDDAMAERVAQQRMRAPSPKSFDAKRPLRLGFVGNDPRRKGLGRLRDAVQLLRRGGEPVELAAVGKIDPEYGGDGVQLLGPIDKRRDMERFLQTIAGFDLGCLPSHAEALGISTLEVLRLGIPAMGSDVGGIPDCIRDGDGFLTPVDATADELARQFKRLLDDPEKYNRMRRSAVERRLHWRWERAAKEFAQIWRQADGRTSTT